MELTQLQINIEEDREPTQEELNLAAAKQLMMELSLIKRRIYESKTLINGVLVVQVKGMISALMRKYNEVGMLQGENVTLKMSDYGKHASMYFEYSPGLKELVNIITKQMLTKAQEELEGVNNKLEKVLEE